MRYAPLYIIHFALAAPCRILDATLLKRKKHRYEEIDNVPDRLRWKRHSLGLLQAEVAQRIGISRHAYRCIENGERQSIPPEVLKRLSELYNVPMSDFADDFTRFLQEGQAQRILAYRTSLGLDRIEFARKQGISIRSLQNWETGEKTMTRASWERFFKGRT